MTLQLALAYAQEHAASFLAGAIITRPVLCADLLFKGAMKVPGARALILLNWSTISAWIDALQAQFAKDVDAEKQKEAPPAVTPPAAAPPAA